MYWVADFETDASHFDKNGKPILTYVWGWKLTRVNGNERSLMYTGSDIKSFLVTCSRLTRKNDIVYFHNLKFDGKFIIDYLIRVCRFVRSDEYPDKMPKGSFRTFISGLGVWYSITIKDLKGNVITINDSLKKLPFSEKKIAKDLKLPVQKGEIDYSKRRIPGAPLSAEDDSYLNDDVRIMAYAMWECFVSKGLNRMTIGSDCLHMYKTKYKKDFDFIFPKLDNETDNFIRGSYIGGITYVKGGEHECGYGCTFDATSLYPSVMHSKSKNYYPYGEPVYFDGGYEYDPEYPLYVLRFTLTAKVKKNCMPFVNMRNMMFGDKEYAEEFNETTLTMTSVDIELLFKYYNVDVFEPINGYKFMAKLGMFDSYINDFFKMKDEASKTKNPVLRTIAKLFINNLYGKFGTNPLKSEKIPIGVTDKGIEYDIVNSVSDPVYIPVGTFVTAYGRKNLLENVHNNWEYFEYCDTDSVHLSCKPDKAKITAIGTNLCEWKLESQWDKARFIRQKTYVEHIVWDDKAGFDIDPYYDWKCAGASPEVKALFTWDNFHSGLGPETDTRFSKCKKRIVSCKGGVVITKGPFSIHS